MSARAEAGRVFRHKIGDALYSLVTPYECNDAPDYIDMYPVIKVTDCYVWVNGCRHWNRDRRYQLSREDLEGEGSAYSRALRRFLYARPQLDWPLLVVDVRDSRPAAITPDPERNTMTTPLSPSLNYVAADRYAAPAPDDVQRDVRRCAHLAGQQAALTARGAPRLPYPAAELYADCMVTRALPQWQVIVAAYQAGEQAGTQILHDSAPRR